ncbi:hypothetical protein EUGRSUZ_G00344 [Eucalyptus grandis]|uniref:Uncharacterized protein n=2 Tax=Eucalyptus grandis TaxID=71139 RepID=A0ACC3K160_EUCGR|nr:hypothetical protein EUGRSUZ_G00344 [Eucalyptus grandis]
MFFKHNSRFSNLLLHSLVFFWWKFTLPYNFSYMVIMSSLAMPLLADYILFNRDRTPYEIEMRKNEVKLKRRLVR